jgi:squalene/oxidosqualene cyclase-like protein
MSAVPSAPVSTPIGLAIERGAEVLRRTQRPDGSWKGDYSGPLFLTPLYLAARHATGTLPTGEEAAELVRYLRSVQADDGSFGLGIETSGCLFTTVLNYVALRMLGVPVDDTDAQRARRWLLQHGGASQCAAWGRVVLAILGLQPWEGVAPIPPELWLLPGWTPVHPSRLWCHTRMVYLPMSWLYGNKVQLPLSPVLMQVRDEVHVEPYAQIDWARSVHTVAEVDAVVPRGGLVRAWHRAAGLAEPWLAGSSARRRALDEVLHQIAYEDSVTGYRCIGPVSKALHVLVWQAVAPGGEQVQAHLATLDLYLWRDERGARMQGYESSQLWDTAFVVQALAEAPELDAHDVMQRAHAYIDREQILHDLPERQRHYRDATAGAWTFSGAAQGWSVSDCTAEGLLAAVAARPYVASPVPAQRLQMAVELLLRSQNDDGGWSSYEPARAGRWLEALNPSDSFVDIMAERSYNECTSSVLQALACWRSEAPAALRGPIEAAITRGRDFLLRHQRPDGLWYGSWGVCFTYGTWFAVHGLRAAGLPASHPALQRAAEGLIAMQLADGGWGESMEACRAEAPRATEHGQAVMTSWAVLALAGAGRAQGEAARAGVRFLLDRQAPDGTWPPEAVAGVFNRSCSIHYDVYLKVFPLWALARYQREVAA